MRLGVTLVDPKDRNGFWYLVPRPGGKAYWTDDLGRAITESGWDPRYNEPLRNRLRFLQVYIPDTETE